MQVARQNRCDRDNGPESANRPPGPAQFEHNVIAHEPVLVSGDVTGVAMAKGRKRVASAILVAWPPGESDRSTRTAVELLASAAQGLPAVDGACLLLSDIHQVLFELACRARGTEDRDGRHRLADQAEAMLAAYLVEVGQATQNGSVSNTLRSWPDRHDPVHVKIMLADAAQRWHRHLGARRLRRHIWARTAAA